MTQPLCTDGSALNNVIRELSREASLQGIRSAVAAADSRGNRFPHARTLPVDFLASLSREYLSTSEMHVDVILGHLGLRRRNVGRLYRPIAAALDATAGPIIVHDGFLGAAGLVSIKRRHPQRPIVLYVHNSLSRGYSRHELRRFLALADSVVCVSGAIRDAVADHVGGHSTLDKLVVVHNGVDSTRFHPVGHGPRDVPSILFVGMMTEFKGPHVLMAALKVLRARGVGFTATFLGSSTHAEGLSPTPYEEALRRDQRQLGDGITFRPFLPHPDVPSIYQQHDILVVPSQFDEPFGLVLAEGMASGLATVAARRGGLPEVGAGCTDLFDSVEGLVGILHHLIADPHLRSHQGQRARRRALQLTWSSTLAQLRAVVDPTVARPVAGVGQGSTVGPRPVASTAAE